MKTELSRVAVVKSACYGGAGFLVDVDGPLLSKFQADPSVYEEYFDSSFDPRWTITIFESDRVELIDEFWALREATPDEYQRFCQTGNVFQKGA